MSLDETKVHRCFMDGIDWQYHLEADAAGTRLFPSEKSLRERMKCIATGGCGIVEVEVHLIRWVEPQDLKWDHTNHAPDEWRSSSPVDAGLAALRQSGNVFARADYEMKNDGSEFAGSLKK